MRRAPPPDDGVRLRRWLAAVLCGAVTPGADAVRRHLPAAESEGVAALLREAALRAHAGDAAAGLREAALREAARDARRDAVLARALDALAGSGVPALVFKGAALAHSHYPRPALRPRDDSDVLVAPCHAGAAGRVLAGLGFEAAPRAGTVRVMRQRLYRLHDDAGALHNVDLHWALSNSVRGDALAPRALLARSLPAPALGRHARAPGAGDALLIACLHLDAHHPDSPRLLWLLDVHLLAAGLAPAARARVARQALALGLRDPCAWVLGSAAELFHTPLHGFESLGAAEVPRAPSPRRAAQWWRELAHLPGPRARGAWLLAHALPPADVLRGDAGTPLAWRHARRWLRGVAHLLR